MKRGNTALKRGVGLASAFALAIAGAVVAAPAASAAPTTTGGSESLVRAQPIADAIYVAADGSLRSASPADNVYNGTDSSTGAVPTVKAGGNAQPASSIQIAVPVGALTNANSIELALGGGVAFAADPAVTVIANPVVGASLDNVAGLSAGTTSSRATSVTGSDALTGDQLKFTVARSNTGGTANDTVTITPKATVDPNLGGTGFYLVTVQGVRVNVPADFNADQGGAVDVTMTDGGATTIAFVAPVSLIATSASADRAFDGSVTLPDVTISELVTDGFAGSYTLTASSNPAPAAGKPDVSISAGTYDVTDSNGTVAGAAGASTAVAAAGTLTVTIGAATAASTTKSETATVSGIKVDNVPEGASVTLSFSAPVAAATNEDAAGAASTFAFTPGYFGAGLTVATANALPRIAGPNRYATAWQIAKEFVGTGNTNKVILANGTDKKDGADALSANFLAGALGAPILLVKGQDPMPVETQYALLDVTKGATGEITIYAMGKFDSVSQADRDKAVALLKAAGHSKVTVKEVAGDNREETSAAALKEAGAGAIKVQQWKTGASYLPTAFLASITSNADALAAGGVSYAAGIPVLLTKNDALSDAVTTAIKDNGIKQVVILGSSKDRVSEAVATSLADLGVTNVERIAGSDRYDTAAQIAEWNWTVLDNTNSQALLANGTTGWPDALTAGPLAGKTGSPLLTVQKLALPDSTAKFLTTHKADLTAGVKALGTSAGSVDDSVVKAAQGALK